MFQNSLIGPIYVETETELKFVSAMIQQKVGELKAKSETGSKLSHSSSTAGNVKLRHFKCHLITELIGMWDLSSIRVQMLFAFLHLQFRILGQFSSEFDFGMASGKTDQKHNFYNAVGY